MAIFEGTVPTPVGDTYRSFGSTWFNGANVAREDWQRAEQSAQLAFDRDLIAMDKQYQYNSSLAQADRDFNAAEAEKAFERQKYLASNQYSMAIEDMKRNGINPILAIQQGGASPVSSASASSSGHSTTSMRSGSSNVGARNNRDPMSNVMSGLIGTVTTILGAYLSQGTSLAVQAAGASAQSALQAEKQNRELRNRKNYYDYTHNR